MARRIKKIGGKKQTWPIKDEKHFVAFINYWAIRRDKSNSEVKRFQADRNWMMCMLGVNTAFRAEDLLQLRVAELIKGFVSIKENKTGKHQNFRMSKELHQDLIDYVKRNELTEQQYLFPGQKNLNFCITRQRSHDIVIEAAHAVGIYHPFGLHGLRKTFGYHFIKNGGNVVTLMKMLNHDDTHTTLMYVMWTIDDAQSDRYNTYFSGKKRIKKQIK